MPAASVQVWSAHPDPIATPSPLIDHPVVYVHELPVNGASWNHVTDPGSCHVNKEPAKKEHAACLRSPSATSCAASSGFTRTGDHHVWSVLPGQPLRFGKFSTGTYPGGRPGEPPFPTVSSHGATQAIATGLGHLLLRTGRADLQDRRDARRAARPPPRRPAQASALHRPEGVVFLCLPEPSVDTAR